MPRKLKVYGITTFVPGSKFRGQWRYVAAVFNQKEFVELLHSNLHFVRNFGSKTHNENEIKQAMSRPHTLIPIAPIDHAAKHSIPDDWEPKC